MYRLYIGVYVSFLFGCACAVVWVLHVLPVYVPVCVQVILAWVVLWVLVDLIFVQPSSWTRELEDIKYATQAVFALQNRIYWRLVRLEATLRTVVNDYGFRKCCSR
jgi:hypothetical protein